MSADETPALVSSELEETADDNPVGKRGKENNERTFVPLRRDVDGPQGQPLDSAGRRACVRLGRARRRVRIRLPAAERIRLRWRGSAAAG